jgi:type VI secretion system protein ImpB
MATDSGARFIRRNRAPRVHISYEDPYDAERQVELPFVMGVLADLSGNNPGVEKTDVANRKFLDIDMDNFESRMAAIEPGVSFRVANKLGESAEGGSAGDKMSVSLRFKSMDDFTPGKVARQVPPLAKLLQAREQLSNLLRYMDGKVAAEDQLKKLLRDPSLMAALKERAASGGNEEAQSKTDETEEK